MFARFSYLPRLNSFVRTFNFNSTLLKQVEAQTEAVPVKNENATDLNSKNPVNANKNDRKQNYLNKLENKNKKLDLKKYSTNDQKKTVEKAEKAATQQDPKQAESKTEINLSKKILQQQPNQQESAGQDQENTKPKEDSATNKSNKTINGKETWKLYNEILSDAEKLLDKQSINLIRECQKLIELSDFDPFISAKLINDPVRGEINNFLLKNIKTMNGKDFTIACQFLIKTDARKINKFKEDLESRANSLDINQLMTILTCLRSIHNIQMTISLTRSLTGLAMEKLDQIDNANTLQQALKVYANDESLVRKLDEHLKKLESSIKSSDWIDILNTKSILRQRNPSILELCSYNLINRKDMYSLTIDQIQKCLLSCGILNFKDDDFLKFLMESFGKVLKLNEKNKKWFESSQNDILSIINSIGILGLRDENLIDFLCNSLNNNLHNQNKLLVSFIITCGYLNYKPRSTKSFESIIKHINMNDFDLKSNKGKLELLNFVWSSCVLDSSKPGFISHVLNDNFWSDLLKENPKVTDQRSILSKLSNINLYSMLFIQNYSGPNLPEDFCLDPDRSTKFNVKSNPSKDLFITALSSFRTLEKYTKLDILTPFGIIIDALMIVNQNGVPCQLENHFDQDGNLVTDKEHKVALKLIEYRDKLKMKNEFNGPVAFQFRLLKELDYTVLPIDMTDFQNLNLINRVKLIEKKLKEIASKEKN